MVDEDGARVESYEAARDAASAAGAPPSNVVLVSALMRWGLDSLTARIARALDGDLGDLGATSLGAAELMERSG